MLDLVPKIFLDSEDGQKLLNETPIKQKILIRLFKRQEIRGFCGLTSAAHVLSSQVLAQKYPDKSSHDHCDITDVRYTEDNIFEHKETQSVLGSAEFIHKRFVGTTLREIAELLRTHGMFVVMKSADESNVDEFRRLAIDALSSTTSGVIINFDHDSKVEWGHFSPLAAYHERNDSFLIMDTRQPYVWVTASDLYPMINTLDPYSKLSRGYLIASSVSSEV